MRTFQDEYNFRLLYDVIQYDVPAIEKAVLYATDNSLVVETSEQAMRVAYDGPDALRGRYDVATLDGVLYRKGGIISGGNQ